MTLGMRTLFHPTSIALVGATDNSGWSRNTFDNLRIHRFPGAVHLVNPRTEVVHGQRAYRSLSEIGQPVDLAYVMVPTAAVLPVLREGALLGIRNYVVLTAGFAETGEDGNTMERAVVEFARDNGLTVLGPNGNGYINAAAGITPYGLPVVSLVRGSVGVVLQSGALASSILSFAQARNVGVSLLTSMGNEAMVSVTDVMDYLVDSPDTKVIALFLESVRRPDEFARVARRAAAAGKPVVALKIGASQLASRTARAHTGALVGDDAVADAAFRRLGVIRVRSLEDLVITAGLLASAPRLPGRRVGVVTPSGGASEIIADRAEQEGLVLPEFAPATVAALAGILPDFATVQNPLDVTGYVVVDRTLLPRALRVVADDPGIDEVMLLSDLPRVVPPQPVESLAYFRAAATIIEQAPRPVVVVSNVLTDISEFGRTVQREAGYPYVMGGIEHGMTAVGNAVRWAERRIDEPEPEPVPVHLPDSPSGTWAEHRAAGFLAEHGVPVVPTRLVTDAEAAVDAARELGYPAVLKAAADDLAHKSDIGGVRLGLVGDDAVREAFTEVTALLADHGVGCAAALVQPQRSGGIELLVGVVRDPVWGPVMAVGLGGVWVEVLRDTAQRLVPVSDAEVRSALAELRGAAVLRGARGGQPADLAAVAAVITRIVGLAASLGDRLESLEVNPLLVRGSEVEVLDALITWR
ncbi:MAG TPA: acetate--CoA ligase family protein [Pseudonocardiaceae bacterium]|nr:acetate--CoA ligase family protein [Pseudonocardiaceae bacterium]